MLFLTGIIAVAAHGAYAKHPVVSFTVGGREVDAVVPDCKSAHSPIILSLHAWATTKGFQKSLDRFSEHIGSECAIILYPQGKVRGALFGMVGFSWNAGGCCPEGNSDHIDDVGFLQEVISEAGAKFAVDAQHVFVAGVSNGGMMANRLACTDERVKAMVAVSGPLVNGTDNEHTESFSCKRSIPVLHFHGLEDPIVPFDGCNASFGTVECRGLFGLMPGRIAQFPRIEDYIADWRNRNGVLEFSGETSFQNGTCSCTTWGESVNNVTLCTLAHEGHAWPGGCSWQNKIPGLTCTMDVDASGQAMAFFRKYLPSSTVVV